MRYQYVPAADETVDPSYTVLREDGTPTTLSIQDCRSYGGGFVVSRCGFEREGDEDSYFVEEVGFAKTLAKAKAIAEAAASQSKD